MQELFRLRKNSLTYRGIAVLTYGCRIHGYLLDVMGTTWGMLGVGNVRFFGVNRISETREVQINRPNPCIIVHSSDTDTFLTTLSPITFLIVHLWCLQFQT